jgi:hypothetical protein
MTVFFSCDLETESASSSATKLHADNVMTVKKTKSSLFIKMLPFCPKA